MTRNKKAFACVATAITLGVGIFTPMGAFAEEEKCFSVGESLYGTFGEARNSLGDEGGNIKMICDVSVTNATYGVTKDVVLDLNGHTFSMTTEENGREVLRAMNGHSLTIDDTSENKEGRLVSSLFGVRAMGEGDSIIINAGTIESTTSYAAIVLSNSSLTINGGSIIGGGNAAGVISFGAVEMNGGSTSGDVGVSLDDGGVFKFNDGEVSGKWGVTVFNDSEIIMNGGTIKATSIGISGNGTTNSVSPNYGNNAKFTLYAGVINSDSLGIYAPQADGVTTLGEGLTVNAKECGVEIRAGELNANGATINVDADAEYDFNPNGSGSTASGVAIAVAQHTTTMPISANVNAGKFTAPVAFAESNPQGNSEEDIAKVALSIVGGDFNATNGDPIVASEDVVKFIEGGTFNKEVDTNYVADGYDLYDLGQDGPWVVDEATTVELPEVAYLQVGETYEIELSEIAKKYGTFGGAHEIVKFEGDKATVIAAGKDLINFQLHNYKNPVDTNIEVIAYSVVPVEEDALSDEVEKDSVAEYATNQIAELINNNASSNDNVRLYGESDKSGVESLKERLANGEKIVTEVFSDSFYDKDSYSQADAYEEIKEALGGDQILKMFDAQVLIKSSDGTPLGQIINLDVPATISIELDEEDLVVPEGYTRSYYVIRGHVAMDGSEFADKIVATLDGKILTFESDKFSTFVIAYTDTEETVEEPSDNDGEVESTEKETEANAPNTGTMTAAGASAANATVAVAVLVGVITIVASCVVMIKRK